MYIYIYVSPLVPMGPVRGRLLIQLAGRKDQLKAPDSSSYAGRRKCVLAWHSTRSYALRRLQLQSPRRWHSRCWGAQAPVCGSSKVSSMMGKTFVGYSAMEAHRSCPTSTITMCAYIQIEFDITTQSSPVVLLHLLSSTLVHY